MKGARKLTFEDSGAQTEAPPTRSPRKSAKVSIRSPGDNSILPKVVVNVIPPVPNPPDIQFSQHYDQSTPPPNCTSNGSYDFVEPKPDEVSDPCNDPQLLEVATKFVNEIIETAKIEAASREKVMTQILWIDYRACILDPISIHQVRSVKCQHCCF